ncbi:MAG: PilZ domain-containing protein [Myxococcales bacterium]|nr:PilZ domain-containing protein [Myxococcales bacterium]MCB9702610.1 PilZ domain-containing protein [Myxococcales bacterium]
MAAPPLNPRFTCDLEATIEIIGRSSVPGLAREITTGGVCVLTELPVAPGSEVNLHLRLILERFESETLVIPGQILWSTRTEGHFQIGAAFGQMPVELWQRLDVLLRFLSGEIAFDPQQQEA